MTDWTKLLIRAAATIRQAIEVIDAGCMQIAFVVDSDGRLLGAVSDGDVRRAILRGIELGAPATQIMNANPLVARPGDDRDAILAVMQEKQIHRVPVVDSKGRMIGLDSFDELVRPPRRDNAVVLMAGGRGTRLRPLTAERPKPMLHVGSKPILETILSGFIEHGFHRFFISVNYMAEMIKDHFGDGSRWNVEIRYLEEAEAMGTAGCLRLLPDVPTSPIVVMNGDVLTRINLNLLLDFHERCHAAATLCVREYDFQVPYGVVKLDNDRLVGIEEKPVQRFFVSAGIYVLEPAALKLVPSTAPYDMPSLFQSLMDRNMATVVFPIREYWLDVGRHGDLEKASHDLTMWPP
jgi:dTDP-glucose pyrophosphorylase